MPGAAGDCICLFGSFTWFTIGIALYIACQHSPNQNVQIVCFFICFSPVLTFLYTTSCICTICHRPNCSYAKTICYPKIYFFVYHKETMILVAGFYDNWRTDISIRFHQTNNVIAQNLICYRNGFCKSSFRPSTNCPN